jgi:phage replication-related protein YjqB (UPF0714/DUF867 family)
MEDTYINFSELVMGEGAPSKTTYTIETIDRGTPILVMAPHGGGIDMGTEEIGQAVASNNLSFYCFSARLSGGNARLHIRSENFDEPEAVNLAIMAMVVLAIHGCVSDEEQVFVGGRNKGLGCTLADSLRDAGFHVPEETPPEYAGADLNNICNCCQTQEGVQLEISRGLRKKMFAVLATRNGRKRTTEVFDSFVTTVRQTIDTWEI